MVREEPWLVGLEDRAVCAAEAAPPGAAHDHSKGLTRVLSLKSEVYLERGRILSNSLYLLDKFVRYHPNKI